MIHYRLYGKEPIRTAVIHGGPGAPGSVAAIARKLSENMGIIEPIQTRTTISDLLIELHETLSRHCTPPVTLIGHSWGAWLACLYAAGHAQMAQKVILVGSGPFEPQYVSQINQTRSNHLPPAENEEYRALLQALNAGGTENDDLLKRLGELVEKTDHYCCLPVSTEKEDELLADAEQYAHIWNEAAAMRRSGFLLERAAAITCPVVAIHGDYDPHPADGVRIPLSARLTQFTFYLLKDCGHSPWKEKYAAHPFYEILNQLTHQV
jgi:pimeloyl-ACP methyl ester carboxylesterase